MKKFTITTAACLALLGCAGTKFSFSDARRIEPGMTQQQVQSIMGRPYSVTSRGGKEIWVWSYANGMTGAHQSIAFIFKNGVVESTPSIPDSFR